MKIIHVETLKNFDSLPDSANVRQPVVQALLSCSPATVWRMVRRGQLTPKKISPNVTTFSVRELRTLLGK